MIKYKAEIKKLSKELTVSSRVKLRFSFLPGLELKAVASGDHVLTKLLKPKYWPDLFNKPPLNGIFQTVFIVILLI